jgi:transposase-like protein
VEEFRRSGLGRKEFADSVGVHVNTLFKWLRQEPSGKTPRGQVAVPVRVRAEAPGAMRASALEVVLRGGRTIRVHGEFDRRTLVDLVDTLEVSC